MKDEKMNKGILRTVVGDVTMPQFTTENEIAVIPHVCNNLGVMGAGVAYALKKKWPNVDNIYKNSSMELGSVSCVTTRTEDNVVKITVANMVSQNGIVSEFNPKPIKYWALAKAMLSVKTFCQNVMANNPDKKVVIHAPRFGSDLAGGNWDFILELIREIWLENGIDVVIYEFKG